MRARFYICTCPNKDYRSSSYGVWAPVQVAKKNLMRCSRCGLVWAVEDEQDHKYPISHFSGERHLLRI